ncbi:hypothetical protein, partial [Bartonella vinsonii]|uniref:hypothetical protein n=1 Tax=Bartonella vinsonii TaxID=33047 RepID=UPI001FEE18CA
MIAFLSNVFSVNAGDVQPKNVKANEKAKSSRISSSVPVNEQVTASDPMNAGVMNVDVTASAEGLQANDVGAEVSFMEGQGAPVTERALVSYNDPTSLRARLAANTGSQQFVQSDEKPSIINVSDLLQSTLNNGMQRAVDKGVVGTNVVFGNDLKFAPKVHNETDNVVIGTNISMLDVDSVAVGFGVQVDQSQAVAVGHLAHAVGKKSIAIGGEGRVDNNPIPPEGRTVSGGDYSIAVGHRAKTSKADGIAIGHMAHTTGISSVAIGGDYNKKSEHGDDDYTTAGADYTTAVGAVSKALGYGSTVLGHRAYASAEKAISIGLYSKASEAGSIALGTDSNVTVKDGIALGRDSVASRDAGILGYAPSLKGTTTNTKAQWKSTHGVVSVGDYDKNITRQITGVAAGSELSDAVNVGQLKDLEDVVRKNGWKLSVDNANGTTVPMNSGVDFSAESKNLKITKGDKDNKVKFDLAKDVTLSSAKMGGGTTLDATGLVIVNGPKITTTGISAGNKEIKDIKNGDLSATSNQAVNGSQLFETNKNVTTVSNDLKTVAQHVAQYFGGGAGYTNGKWSDPNFKVNTFKSDGSTVESTYHTVAEALADVGSSFTNIKNKINAERSNELVKWDEDTKSINIGKEKGDAKISIADKGSQSRILSGLKEAEKGDEAVNKAQLDQNVHKLSNDINNVRSVAVFYDTEEVSAFTRSVRKEVKKNSVTFGNPKEGTVGLHNVGNGNIAKDSHDAVNGSQLYSMGDTVATYFGGSASFKDGSLIAPTYKISNVTEDGKATEKSYNDVGNAFVGLDTSVKNVNTHLTNEVKKFEEKITNITQEVQGDALLWSKDAHAFVATHGEKDSKTNSKITSLLDGAINDSSTDAVTGKQLHTLGTGVAKSLGGNAKYENGTWSDPTFKVKSFAFDGSFSDSTYNDVASAFEGVGTSFEKVKDSITNVKNEITQEIKNEITTVQGDALLWDNAKSAFVATHGKEGSKTNSKLTSLLDGTINDSSTDAVTGKQLHSLGDKVAKSLGGGANYENGTWISPKFTVKTVKDDGETIEERKYDTVAEALAGVGTSFTNIKNDITNVVSDSLVKWDEDTKSINIGKEKDDAKISIADKNSKSRTLSGLKAAEKGDEAVNKAQLDENVNTLTNEIKDVRSVAVFYDTEENSEDSDVSTFMRSARKAKRNSVTFGNPKEGTVGLHNVGDGNIAKDSHDAVNGSQLYSMGDTVATYFGGSASFKDGSLTAPTYKISNVTDDGKATEKSYNDVGSAFAGLDTSVKNVNTHLTQEVKKFEEKITNITQAVQGDALLWSKSDNAFVATHGENKGNSKITSLQAGQIAEASSDAINGSQLYSVGDTVAKYFGGGAGYKNGEWTAPQFTVKKFSAEGEATEENYNNVADAFAEISSSVTKIHNEFKDEINTVVSDNLVKQDKDRAPITIGKETDGVEINIQNKNKEDRVLSGVKEASKDNEAVNKAQLEKSLKELSKNIQSEDSAVILYDKGTDGKTDYSNVTFGKGKDSTPVGLHNVADGKIAKDSRDAITGGQVNKIGEDVAKFLGGEAAFNSGTFTGPTYKLSKLSEDGAAEETSYDNVGSAFAGLDTSVKNVNTHLTNEVKKFEEKITNITQEVQGDALLW